MAGVFDDLIPQAQRQGGNFDDLIPQKPAPAGFSDSEAPAGDFWRGLGNTLPQAKQNLGHGGGLLGEVIRRIGSDWRESTDTSWDDAMRDAGRHWGEGSYGTATADSVRGVVGAGANAAAGLMEDAGRWARDGSLAFADRQKADIVQQPYDNFSGIGGLGDAVDFLQYNAGQGAGNLIDAAGSALVGAGAGLAVGGLPGAATGASVGLAAPAVSDGLGGTVGKVLDEGISDLSGRRLPDAVVLESLSPGEIGRILAGGSVSAAAEFLGDKVGLGAALHGTGAKSVLAGAGTVAGKEGSTEVAQAVAQRAGAGQELTGKDAAREYVDSFAGGVAQGGMIGGAADGVRAGKSIVDKIIGAESSGNAIAKNPNSSAEGLGQFINSTWLKMIKKYRPDVAAGKSDADLLGMKTDAGLSREMTGHYADENRQSLQRDGFEGSDRNVYLAHHFGDGGAKQLLRASPDAAVSTVMSEDVIRANPYMRGKTVGQVLAIVGKKVGDTDGVVVSAATPDAAVADPSMDMVLRDVEPEPMATRRDDPDADLAMELDAVVAEWQAQNPSLSDEPASTAVVDAADDYDRLEREAIQTETITPAPAAKTAPDVPFAAKNPFVDLIPPAGLKGKPLKAWRDAQRGNAMDWDVQHGAHPAPAAEQFGGDKPPDRNLSDPETAGKSVAAWWSVAPDQQDAQTLTEAIRSRLPLSAAGFEVVLPPASVAGQVQALQQVFGKKVVFVRGNDANSRGLLQGAIVPSRARNRIFVNADAQVGYKQVLGHEIYEHLRRDRPDLHRWFRGEALPYVRNLPAYHERLQAWESRHGGEALTPDDALAELLADFTGDALADRAFLAEVVGKNPSMFARLLAAVEAFLQRLVARMRGRSTSETAAFFTHAAAVRDNLRAALSAYREGRSLGGEAVTGKDDGAEVEFMRFPDSPQGAKVALAGVYRSVMDALRRKASEQGNIGLSLLSFDGLVDRYGAIFARIPGNPMKQLEEGKRMMRAVQMHWANRFQASHDAFLRLDAAERKAVTGVMLDATLLNMHPDREYVQSVDIEWAMKKITNFEQELAALAGDERRNRENQQMTPEQRQLATVRARAGIKSLRHRIQLENKRAEQYPSLEARFEALGDDAKAVYRDWLLQLNRLWEKQTEALEHRIADIVRANDVPFSLEGEIKQTITSLRLKFRKQLEIGPYFPLKRYGDNVVQIREGAEYSRYHFESRFEAEHFATKVRTDKPGAQVLVTGKVKDVDPGDSLPAVGMAGRLLSTLQKSGALDAEQLKAVNQFVLESLPDLSARKAEMRRYFVEGADRDMERGFANALLHGGHDLGRIQFGHKLQMALAAMREQVRMHSDFIAEKSDIGGDFAEKAARAERVLSGREYPDDISKIEIEATKRNLGETALELARKQKEKSSQFKKEVLLIAEKDLPQAAAVTNTMTKQVNALLSPDTSSWAAFSGNLAFMWYLGFSPVAGLINVTQTQQVTFPVLAARFGAIKAQMALQRAALDVMKAARLPRDVDGRFDVRQGMFATSQAQHLKPDERAVLQALELDGTTVTTQANEVARTASGDGRANVGDVTLKLDRAMAFGGFFFHNAEIMNRQVAQLAAMRLLEGADAELKNRLSQEHGGAIGFARWVTERTHFDYSHGNRSLFTKSNTAKMLLPMKSYSFLITEFLLTRTLDAVKRETDPEVKALARQELGFTLGMTALLAGASGLPMMWLIGLAASLFGGDEDEPWDAKSAWNQWLRNHLGNTGEAVVNRGVFNATTGLDLSSRIGLSSLFIHDADERSEGGDVVRDYIVQLAGVNASLVIGVADGVQLLEQGQYQKGVEKMIPKAFRDLSKAQRYMDEGLTTRSGAEMVQASAFNPVEILAAGAGMTPDEVTAAYGVRGDKERVLLQLQNRRAELMREARQYHMDGDGDWGAIRQSIAKFNKANPAVGIRMVDIKQSVKQARHRRRQQTLDSGLNMPESYRKALEQRGF